MEVRAAQQGIEVRESPGASVEDAVLDVVAGVDEEIRMERGILPEHARFVGTDPVRLDVRKMDDPQGARIRPPVREVQGVVPDLQRVRLAVVGVGVDQ